MRVRRSAAFLALVPWGLSAGEVGPRFVPATSVPFRLVRLNGVNISGVRNQRMENVTVVIDEHGNLDVRAPHLEAVEDTAYVPLFPSRVQQAKPKTGVSSAGKPPEEQTEPSEELPEKSPP